MTEGSAKQPRQLTRDDFLSPEEYQPVRRERNRQASELKRRRRVEIGPYAIVLFENSDTVRHQIQEMLYIEKGGDAQLRATLKGVAVGLHRELAAAPDRERVRRRAHRGEVVRRPWVGPAHRRQAIAARASLDLGHPDCAAIGIAERPRAPSGEPEQPAKQNRLPAYGLRQQGVDPLGRQVRERRPKIEVEGDGHRGIQIVR